MRRVFKKVRAMGGYRAVCDSKLWMRVCREASGGKDLSGQTSASFAMRRNYEKTGLLEMEHSVDGTSLPGGLPFVVFDPDAGKDFIAVDSDEICQPGTRVRVLWNEPNGESAWYGATVQSFDETTKKHKVLYDDETEEDEKRKDDDDHHDDHHDDHNHKHCGGSGGGGGGKGKGRGGQARK